MGDIKVNARRQTKGRGQFPCLSPAMCFREVAANVTSNAFLGSCSACLQGCISEQLQRRSPMMNFNICNYSDCHQRCILGQLQNLSPATYFNVVAAPITRGVFQGNYSECHLRCVSEQLQYIAHFYRTKACQPKQQAVPSNK